MAKQTYNQDGFHVIGVVFALLVVGVIGFAGLRVFHLRGNSSAASQAVKTIPGAAEGAVPSGWQKFTDPTIGAAFLYPNAFGVFSDRNDIVGSFPDYESLLTSAVPKETGIIGVQGGFTLITYKKGHDTITSRKFGPKIKLVDGSWQVVEPSPYNPEQYHAGDTYAEMNSTNTTGIDVYSDRSADSGTFSYSLYFVSHDRLHQLQLPTFDNGAATSNNINDQSAYDGLFQQVRDSVTLD